jgi:hypothetical protein
MKIMMRAPTGFALLLLQLGLLIAGQRNVVPADRDAPKLVVTLAVDKATFVVNKPIPVHVRISNLGAEPILIGNDVSLGAGAANLELTLKDAAGRVFPQMRWMHDHFPSQVIPNTSTALLGSWMLLRPGNSLTTTIQIGGETFGFRDKPGRYTLSADYYSDGFSYPGTYRARGLTDEDVKAIPFTCWHGKIATNTVQFKVISSPARSADRTN